MAREKTAYEAFKMASSKENSSMNEGQLWNVWAECLGLKIGDSDEDDAEAEKKKKESDTMRLRKDDMSLFGFCPAWDDFFLAVCEICGSAIKPQSLQSHIELRHGHLLLAKSEKEAVTQDSKSTVNKGSSSSRHHSKTSSHGNSSRTATDAAYPVILQWKPCSSHPMQTSSHNSTNSRKPEKTKPHAKMKKNNTMAPVVRVERIPPNLVKSTNSPSNTVSADKKELPSPQQPPPVVPVTSASTSVTAGLGPGLNSTMVVATSSMPVSTNSAPSAATVVSSVMLSTVKTEGPQLPQKKTSSKNRRVPKERKLVPCKDREYDPNKHCGVVISDLRKPCTRSLTCKTHSLSLRRAVVGRVKVFDDLLAEHRATKEATVKVGKIKMPVSKSSPPASSSADQVVAENPPTIAERTPSTTTITVTNTKTEISPSKMNTNISTNGQFKSPSVMPSTPQVAPKIPAVQSISLPLRVPSTSHGTDEGNTETIVTEVEKRLFEPEEVFTRGSTPDPAYINHHPRPGSMCTFGLRQFSNGMLLLDRRYDNVRAAFKKALTSDRSLHPLTVKRLCVEAHLPPVPEPLDPSDPYSFPCSESSAEAVPQVTQSEPSSVFNKASTVAPADVIQETSPCVTTSSKTKTISVPTTSVTSSHKSSQPKTSSSKTKDKINSNPSKPLSNDSRIYNSPPCKKKRKSSTIPNGSSVSKPSALPFSSNVNNIALSAVTPNNNFTLFPLAIGEQLSTIPRFQVASRNNLPLSSAIISNPGLTTFSSAPQPVMSKDSSVMVTGLEALNGQIPVSSALLHSVTVSRPLLATAAGGLGITIGAAGLVSQFPQLPSYSLGEDLSSAASSNKNSHTINSILNNSRLLASDPSNTSSSTWIRTKAKSKTRKNSKVNVNSVSHSQSACDSSVGSAYSSILSHSLTSPSMPSPHICAGSTSPQVPISSPLHNGLGTSPPPFFNPKTISISGTMSSNQPLSVSPASRTSTPSPGTDMSSPGSTGSGQKVWRQSLGGKSQHRHRRTNPELLPYIQRNNGEKKISVGPFPYVFPSQKFPLNLLLSK